jgi:2-iminobutanoate/2-iminopropanoate deaminase
MTLAEVRSPKVDHPEGAYFSQALKCNAHGTFLYISGLTARDLDGQVVGEGDIELQTQTILESMEEVLKEAGGTLADVVKLTVFVRDIELWEQVHEVRSRYFSPPYPASMMCEVSRFVTPEHLIEIDAVAALGQGQD